MACTEGGGPRAARSTAHSLGPVPCDIASHTQFKYIRDGLVGHIAKLKLRELGRDTWSFLAVDAHCRSSADMSTGSLNFSHVSQSSQTQLNVA